MTPDKTPADRLADEICSEKGHYLAIDGAALSRYREDARHGDGHDMAPINKNSLFRLIGTIDAMAEEITDYRASKVEDDELEALLEELHDHQFQYERDAKKMGKKPSYYWSYVRMEKAIAAITRLQSQSANPWVKIETYSGYGINWTSGQTLRHHRGDDYRIDGFRNTSYPESPNFPHICLYTRHKDGARFARPVEFMADKFTIAPPKTEE